MKAPPRREAALLDIAEVERETRIAKDTLRVWERRYGFPRPRRDAAGERRYPPEQVERLRVVKRLLDAGHRPGGVVGLPPAALSRLGRAAAPADAQPPSLPEATAELMSLLRVPQPGRLRLVLGQALMRQGLAGFVTDTAVPFLRATGAAWSAGELAVYQEHLASDVLDTVLRGALAAMPVPAAASRPRVVMATLQRETHGLGLLMAAALFGLEGCACMSLGCQMPLRDLADAAFAFEADIVAVGSSAGSAPRPLGDALAQLRTLLPAGMELWAGTPHAALRRRPPTGVRLLGRVEDIGPEVAQWRARHATPAPAGGEV